MTGEMVIFYHPCKVSYLVKLKGVLVQMGIRIRDLGPESAGQKVGFLAGIQGYDRVEGEEGLGEIHGEMMILKNFTSDRMNELFARMKKAGIPRIPLKAVVTEYNADWTLQELYVELKKEHEAMNRQ